MRIKILSITLCLIAQLIVPCAAVSVPQDTTIFGMQFGQPLTIPECPTKSKYSIAYESFPNHTCYERLIIYERFAGQVYKEYDKKHLPPTLPPVGTEEVRINYPFSERPEITNTTVGAILIDAKLEGISFGTRGIVDASSVLDRLKVKYGPSPTIVNTKVQNRVGASFDAFYALWIFPTLRVGFHSVSDTVDRGTVVIDTDKGNEWREKRLKEKLKDKHPL
jgi:hypothetical protein